MLEGGTGRMIEVEAKPLRIEVSGDIRNIKIVLPFPFCDKRQ
jgi:hypothetical protein